MDLRHCPSHETHDPSCKRCRKAVSNAKQRAKKAAPETPIAIEMRPEVTFTPATALPPVKDPVLPMKRARPRAVEDLPKRVLALRITHAEFDKLQSTAKGRGISMTELIVGCLNHEEV